MSSFKRIVVLTQGDGGVAFVHADEQGNTSAIMLTVEDLEAYTLAICNAAIAAAEGTVFMATADNAEVVIVNEPSPDGIQLDLFDHLNTKH
jgi:hypothetical protein